MPSHFHSSDFYSLSLSFRLFLFTFISNLSLFLFCYLLPSQFGQKLEKNTIKIHIFLLSLLSLSLPLSLSVFCLTWSSCFSLPSFTFFIRFPTSHSLLLHIFSTFPYCLFSLPPALILFFMTPSHTISLSPTHSSSGLIPSFIHSLFSFESMENLIESKTKQSWREFFTTFSFSPSSFP